MNNELQKPTVVERFADNGEHSHWELVDTETHERLWTESTEMDSTWESPTKIPASGSPYMIDNEDEPAQSVSAEIETVNDILLKLYDLTYDLVGGNNACENGEPSALSNAREYLLSKKIVVHPIYQILDDDDIWKNIDEDWYHRAKEDRRRIIDRETPHPSASSQVQPEEAREAVYEIDFGGNVLAKIKVIDNQIEVVAAMNGYGDAIPVNAITITQLTD